MFDYKKIRQLEISKKQLQAAATVAMMSMPTLVGTPRVFAEDMRYPIKEVARHVDGSEYETIRHPIVYDVRHGNVIVNTGRINVLQSQFLTGAVVFVAGGVGSNTANGTDATQTHLGAELIAGASRPTLTNTSNATLSTASPGSTIALATSQPYNEFLTAQYVYLTTDANNGSTFGEYGLFSSTTLPATSGGTSGIMYCRFVPTSSFVKTNSFQVTVQWLQGA